MLEGEKAILEEALKKPTEDICKKVLSESFFNKIKNVKEVYFFGFSFGVVDMVYINKIFNKLDDKTK